MRNTVNTRLRTDFTWIRSSVFWIFFWSWLKGLVREERVLLWPIECIARTVTRRAFILKHEKTWKMSESPSFQMDWIFVSSNMNKIHNYCSAMHKLVELMKSLKKLPKNLPVLDLVQGGCTVVNGYHRTGLGEDVTAEVFTESVTPMEYQRQVY